MIRTSEQDTQRGFSRRALLLAGGKLGLLGALVARLYYLQVVEADKYLTLSKDNQFNLELLPPIRGRILDRNGVALAANRDNFRIEIVSERTGGDVMRTLRALQTLVRIDDHEIKRVLRDIKRKRGFVPVTVVENLTRDDISRVAVNTPYLPGIRIEVGRSRFYPYGDRAVHVTGYVAAVSETELTGDPVLELPDFRIGKNGVEKAWDLDLRGTAGQRQVEVNALGRIIRKLPGNEGQPGTDISVTIDIELQQAVFERVAQGRSERVPLDDPRAREAIAKAEAEGRSVDQSIFGDTVLVGDGGEVAEPESGAAVVMDAHRGDVVALVSTPAFDPNHFNKGLSARDWEELLSNPRSPMTNKAIAGQYPPGSTFKMLVCLAALESGVAPPDQKVWCPGHLDLGNARFHCWKDWGHGWMDMWEAISQSCDVYFYEIAKKVGIDRISEMARRFGLGETLGIDIQGERRGLVPTREWKLATRGEPWQKGETLIAGIGQGFLLTTPLQLATMTARLVNGGFAVQPRLMRDPSGEAPEAPSMNIDPSHLEIVRDGMYRVINGKHGTARSAQLKGHDYEFAGKTGTAQVRRITRSERLTGKRTNEELPWRYRDHALFVGYAPTHAPRYVTAVVVEHGGSATKMAAPIARDVLAETMAIDPVRSLPPGLALPPIPTRRQSGEG